MKIYVSNEKKIQIFRPMLMIRLIPKPRLMPKLMLRPISNPRLMPKPMLRPIPKLKPRLN